MSTKLALLQLLSEHSSTYLSGQEIADKLSLSRNSVWKAVKSLQQQGYRIESKSGIGYRLINTKDILSSDWISENTVSPCQIHLLEKTDSTNNYAKSLSPSPLPQVVIANEQTGGRGRLGRTFYSPAGAGLYMTISFRPLYGLDRAMLTTAMSAVAVCRAIEKVTAVKTRIKWVNDIYAGGRKVCGILTEAESNFETGRIDKIIVGIGINCFETAMPEDIRHTACALAEASADFTRNQLAAAIIDEFFSMQESFDKVSMLREYKSRSFVLGQHILIFNPAVAQSIGRTGEMAKTGIRARAIDIDENGGLIVEFLEGRRSREMETLTTGEITIRPVYD